jgi:hypothetical protein
MKANVEINKAHVNSVDDELTAIIRNHKSASSHLIRFARAISASKVENWWVIAKTFLETVEMLNDNLASLDKMHSILFSIRFKTFFSPIIQIFNKQASIIPNLQYFSWLLDKVIVNLEKTLDEIRAFLSPTLGVTDQATQSLILALASPVNDITNSVQITKNIKELLSKMSLENQQRFFSPLGELENEIYNALLKVTPSAAMAYKQAVIDLVDRNRISYRGVANEFRETLRETLDSLAPENLVTSQPNFKFENGKTKSTMKQKVRYILKSRGSASNALKAPEDAIEIIENRIASFTRATYDRSSISAHIASERSEVHQIKHYTNAILVELLRIGSDSGVSQG